MEEFINKFFSNNLPTIEEIFNKYPRRNLKEGEKITRFAPSPTGFMHMGNLYSAIIDERVAHSGKNSGIFFLRIEDTDQKREVDGALEIIIDNLKYYGLNYEEGVINTNNNDNGIYGPYTQSKRGDIYKAFVKDLLQKGFAYPCFCTEEELEEIINKQKAQNCSRLGYYGGWAKYRNFPIEEATKKVENGEKCVIRLKSPGDFNKKIVVNDILRGNLEFHENDLDVVILKQDGLPTYHFAHLIDDFLMGTTTVIRGEEWLPSLPLHIQLFQVMKWKTPKYLHISPLMKIDETTGNKRKLSKRKDPENNVEFFKQAGYPSESVVEYLLNLANSNFEDWRRQNKDKSYKDFTFDMKKMNNSGAIFDLVKLNNISKDVISKMTANEIYNNVLKWAEKYNKELFKLITENSEYILKIFNIERENTKKPRKDIAKWSDISSEIEYFFELDENKVEDNLKNFNKEDIKNISECFLETYNENDDNQIWFEKLKKVAEKCGYSSSVKEYKENPDKFKGDISTVATILRVLTTERLQSPDLCSIMKVLGKDRVEERLKAFRINF